MSTPNNCIQCEAWTWNDSFCSPKCEKDFIKKAIDAHNANNLAHLIKTMKEMIW